MGISFVITIYISPYELKNICLLFSQKNVSFASNGRGFLISCDNPIKDFSSKTEVWGISKHIKTSKTLILKYHTLLTHVQIFEIT